MIKKTNLLLANLILLSLTCGSTMAQEPSKVPPPLIIKDYPLQQPIEKDVSDPVVVDLTNRKASMRDNQNAGMVSDPIDLGSSGTETIVIVEKTNAVPPKPVPIINETQIRASVPQVKPARVELPAGTNPALYGTVTKAPEITAEDITGSTYFDETSSVINGKIVNLQRDLFNLQDDVRTLAEQLDMLENTNAQKAAEYHAAVATVNTQLQTGTTPGNPRLLNRITKAQSTLENFSGTVTDLNTLAIKITNSASTASYLLDSTRNMYSLSGAIEEDHINLAKLEDNITNTTVVIERLLNNVNDDITRISTYLENERQNLRTLSLAVANGDLYGKNLSTRPFSKASRYQGAAPTTSVPAPMASNDVLQPIAPAPAAPQETRPSSPRPLVKIRFDKQDVDYEQPVYNAVNQALERYPDAEFDLVAVNPSTGNAAQVAIESTRARRNAERVLRTMTQMGVDMDSINLAYTDSEDAATNEVHLYIR